MEFFSSLVQVLMLSFTNLQKSPDFTPFSKHKKAVLLIKQDRTLSIKEIYLLNISASVFYRSGNSRFDAGPVGIVVYVTQLENHKSVGILKAPMRRLARVEIDSCHGIRTIHPAIALNITLTHRQLI